MTNRQKQLSALAMQLFQPPTPADPGQARLARQIYYLLLLGIPLAFSFVLLDVEIQAGTWNWRVLIPGGTGMILIGLLVLVRWGYVQLAAVGMIFIPLIVIYFASFTKMGIRNPALVPIPLLLMLCSLFLGSRMTILFALTAGGLALLLYFDEYSRASPAQLLLLNSDYLIVVLATIAITTIILHFTLTQLLQSNQRIHQQAEELHAQNQRLIQIQTDLEARTHQLSRLNAELQLEMNERARTEASLRQKQKLESIGLLAGGVAHDFNNLLTSILNQSDLALRRLHDANKARQHIEKALQSTQRAADLTRQLLAYAGKAPFHVEPIDVNGLIQANHSLLETVLQRNASLQFDLQPELPAIVSDRGQLQQVLMNLVINAIEAINHDGGNVLIKTATVTLTDPLDPTAFIGVTPSPGAYVCLTVSDNGAGMASSTIEKIFDPFFSTKQRGHGLGLSVVLGVIQALHGALQVESRLGSGSTFRVYLPASLEEPRPIPMNMQSPLYRPQDQLVLVIDDEEPVRDAVVEMLNTLGYRTLAATGGLEGVALFTERQAEINAIVLDMTMPGMNGLETLQKIRTLNNSIKVVLSSGYMATVVPEAAVQQQATTFLAKPYRLEQLYEALLMSGGPTG